MPLSLNFGRLLSISSFSASIGAYTYYTARQNGLATDIHVYRVFQNKCVKYSLLFINLFWILIIIYIFDAFKLF